MKKLSIIVLALVLGLGLAANTKNESFNRAKRELLAQCP